MSEQKQNPHIVNNVTVNQPTPKSMGVLERDWTTALILSIFLGWFGIDQFIWARLAKVY